jgi:hypothetical protein
MRKKLLTLTGACAIYFAFFNNSLDERRLLNEDSKNKLEFVHITHTGGLAAEKAAHQVGINWGPCHYIGNPGKGLKCNNPDTHLDGNKFYLDMPKHGLLTNVWHMAPHDLEHVLAADNNPYTGKDLFTAVRNPYERIISEYYDAWFGYKGKEMNDPIVLNHWVKSKLQEYAGAKLKFLEQKDSSTNPIEMVVPSDFNQKHLKPQHEYVYDNEGKRVITNVIHFEDMRKEFKKLMRNYGLGAVKLDPSDNGEKRRGHLTRVSLKPDTIAAINDFYAGDFAAFGYNMVQEWNAVTPYQTKSTALPCVMFQLGESECEREVTAADFEATITDEMLYTKPIGAAHSTTFLMGIFSDLTARGAEYRKLARDTYLNTDDARFCTLEEYERQMANLMLPTCRVPYVFVVGSSPDVEANPIDAETTAVQRSLLVEVPADESDVIHLRVVDSTKFEKSSAFLEWATEFGANLQIDFIAKVALDTLVDLPLLMDFIDLDLPAAPYNRRMVSIACFLPHSLELLFHN